MFPHNVDFVANILVLSFNVGFFFYNKGFKKSFIYFWLHWVFVAVRGLLIAVAPLVVEHGL